MEVREPGARYLPARKQTELGELPSDWHVLPFEHFKPFVTSGSRGWARYYAETGSVFLRITNLSRDRIYPSLEDLRYVAVPAGDSEGVRTALAAGDVLISITADIGIVGYVTSGIELPAYINQHIALVRFDPSAVDSRYLAYYMAGSASQLRFRAMTDAGAKAGMNLAAIRQLLAAVPPTKSEQAGIAQALTDADTLIDSLEQLLSKQRQIKQGAMRELLTGQRRLPGFGGEWQEVSFGEVAQPRRDRVVPLTLAEAPLCVELEHIQAGEGCLVGQVPESRQAGLKTVFFSGDVLFGKLRAYQRKHWFAEFDGVCSTEIWALRPIGVLESSTLLYCLVQRDDFIEVASSAYGTHMPRSDWNVVKAFRFQLPADPAEQHAIAQVLTDMDAALVALQARLVKARELKQALMQVLLTGRIRLRPPAEAAAASPG